MSSGSTRSRNPALLEIDGLNVDFWNQDRWVNVLRDVNLSIHQGETVGLVGESGCGKSTTAYTMLGYRRPNSRIRSGAVRFDGTDLLRLPPKALQSIRGKRISLVPQNPTTALSPGMTVGRQIWEVLMSHQVGNSDEERWEKTYELLTHVGLPEPRAAAHKYPHQFSGGQQQRVVIAMALACNPQLVVLDEPTTGLDVTTQAQILELLVYLRAEHGMTMVYVTHDLGVLSLICDRVGVMYAGELIEDAPIQELFSNPRHPYTRGLIASVPSVRNPNRSRSLLQGFLQRDTLPAGCPFAPRCELAVDRCFGERQVLLSAAPEHHVACWRWEEAPALLRRSAQPAAAARPAPPTGRTPLLSIEDIDVGYAVRQGILGAREMRRVVHDVSLDIKPGETFALVGESGSGKSTIARAIAGLLKPLEGKVTFDGQDIGQLVQSRSQDQRRQVQLVFQNPDASLNPRQRVLQILGEPLTIFFGMRGRDLRRRVEQLLEDVRLDQSYIHRYPDELSGGERQRIAIARALAAQPRLILCDEVLSALDVSVQATVIELLRALQAEHELAYLFISHDLAVVRTLAHRVGVLYRGELVEVGTVDEVYAPPYHPYTHALFSAVPEIESQTTVHPAVRGEITTSANTMGCPFSDRCLWKLGEICETTAPPWQMTSATHGLRCHIPLEELHERETWSRVAAPPLPGASPASIETDSAEPFR